MVNIMYLVVPLLIILSSLFLLYYFARRKRLIEEGGYPGQTLPIVKIILTIAEIIIYAYIITSYELALWQQGVVTIVLVVVAWLIWRKTVPSQEGQPSNYWVKIKSYGKGRLPIIVGIVLLVVIVVIAGWYFFGPADRFYTPEHLQSMCTGCLYGGNYILVSGQNKLVIPSGEFGGMKVVAETKAYNIRIGDIVVGYKEQDDGKPTHYVGIAKVNLVTGGEDSYSIPLEKAIETYNIARFEISIQLGPQVFFPIYTNPRNPTVYINGFEAVEGDGLGKTINGDIVITSPNTETKVYRVETYDTSFTTRMQSLLYFIGIA